MKTAIITGGAGQDGAYLARHLLELGYTVVCGSHRAEPAAWWRLIALSIRTHPRLKTIRLDITDEASVRKAIGLFSPDEIYNLAARSHVSASFSSPSRVNDVNGRGAINILEAVRKIAPDIRVYQASTSDMFGDVTECPQNENTALRPRSPYAAAKAYAHSMAETYRKSYGLFVSCGILYNHESPLREPEFVTRKITQSVARIRSGELERFSLGNLDASRDWGYAGDYVKGMHAMLQTDAPGTFVLASGQATTVRDFAAMAFSVAGFELQWDGSGDTEVGCDRQGICRVNVDPQFYRPVDVQSLVGDASLAKRVLGWEPRLSVNDLCSMMVKSDMAQYQDGRSDAPTRASVS